MEGYSINSMVTEAGLQGLWKIIRSKGLQGPNYMGQRIQRNFMQVNGELQGFTTESLLGLYRLGSNISE